VNERGLVLGLPLEESKDRIDELFGRSVLFCHLRQGSYGAVVVDDIFRIK
jgi:hypothetical protein